MWKIGQTRLIHSNPIPPNNEPGTTFENHDPPTTNQPNHTTVTSTYSTSTTMPTKNGKDAVEKSGQHTHCHILWEHYS